uniref:CTTNBP2 N-terminal like a n=2 Tax=Oryzias melastigma TaxID=30732 RepID=A0A3B3DPM4_ORYME
MYSCSSLIGCLGRRSGSLASSVPLLRRNLEDTNQVREILQPEKKFRKSLGHMKSQLNMENLSKPELLRLFSILEGELEARDLVIEALKAQCKHMFIHEHYGKYNLSDPFHALQRDSELMGQNKGCSSPTSNPLVVLKMVVSHCRKMQEKMLAQLAAAESRHRRVIADLEEEKRRHAEDTAEGDDVTYILEKDRERLQQQLEFERSQVRRLEKEQWRVTEQLEEERAQHKHLSCALAKECKWASARALEEGHLLTELNHKLDKEKEACHSLRKELEDERARALRMEARVEEQLAEFDTEREQLRSRLKKEEAHCSQLQQQVKELMKKLEEAHGITELRGTNMTPVEAEESEWASRVCPGSSLVESMMGNDSKEDLSLDQQHVNSHRCSGETNGYHDSSSASSEKTSLQNGTDTFPLHHSQMSPPGSSTPSPMLAFSSPCAKRSPGSSGPGGYQSPYQAGINQRFHAARHKFQSPAEPESPSPAGHPALPLPTTCGSSPEASPVKQMARSTVTQVLSRFTTVQQSASAKHASQNNSPFGTDYRSLAAPLSPAPARAAGTNPQPIPSPTISRVERGNPPPIPPKKPGLVQAPLSPAVGAKSASPLSGSCGLTSAQEGVLELDMVVSSN